MAALVIKEWKVGTKAIDEKNNFISITGRKGGLIAWFMSLIGIDPTTKIVVGMNRLEFTANSLAGTASRMIPLQNICSTYYGYYKPIKEASATAFVFMILAGYLVGAVGVPGSLLVFGVGLVIALIQYFLNRELTLGFVEHSGVVNGIRFKRSVIENIDVNEEQAKSACIIIQKLIEAKEKRNLPGANQAV